MRQNTTMKGVFERKIVSVTHGSTGSQYATEKRTITHTQSAFSANEVDKIRSRAER